MDNGLLIGIALLIALILVAVIIGMVNAENRGYHKGYKDGQLDALSGKAQYELKENNRGERVWTLSTLPSLEKL